MMLCIEIIMCFRRRPPPNGDVMTTSQQDQVWPTVFSCTYGIYVCSFLGAREALRILRRCWLLVACRVSPHPPSSIYRPPPLTQSVLIVKLEPPSIWLTSFIYKVCNSYQVALLVFKNGKLIIVFSFRLFKVVRRLVSWGCLKIQDPPSNGWRVEGGTANRTATGRLIFESKRISW
jgi:hypothetical protein